MNNKGLIKLFALLFGLVSIYQLSYTFITAKIESDAEAYAVSTVAADEENYVARREQVEARYLDSVAKNPILGFTSYEDAKKKELNKGLDLKGGINVTLQISVRDILSGLANNTKNPVFNKALADADAASKNSDATYLELFFDAFDEIKGDTKLASPDIFANKGLSDEVNFEMGDEEVKPIIRRKVDEAVISAFEVLRERIDGFGVTQPNIQREGNSGRILVELPGARDIARAQDLLSSTAQLEFWETYEPGNQNLINFFIQANEELKSIVEAPEEAPVQEESEIDSLLSDVAQDSLELASERNPLFEKLQLNGPGYAIGLAAIKDTAEIGAWLRMPRIRRLLPTPVQFTKFMWERPSQGSEVAALYALKSNRDGVPRMSGDVVSDARDQFDQFNRPAVGMDMNVRGAREWQELTNEANLNNTGIAIVLDNRVYTAPGVSQKGGIAGGSSEITGTFTVTETKDVANVLRAGKLPAEAEIIDSFVVGPSLGQEAIDSGFTSFIIAMIFVLLWMIFYYGKAGVFSDIALVFNIVLIFGVLASLGAVLTLPGIAGIVLTIGMSVDANVLIFERIKEELQKGKGMAQAVSDGFDNALSSILDANITTGLTALILLVFGTGPIKGFATTLIIGILTSLFTAIFVTRLLIDAYLSRRGRRLDFATGVTKNLFQNINIDFLAKRKVAYVVSGILILAGLASLFTRGLDQGVDFVGGRNYQIRFVDPVNPAEITGELTDALGSASAKTFGDANQIMVTTKYKVDVQGTEVDEEILGILYNSLQKYLPDGASYQDFIPGGTNEDIGVMKYRKVGPTIADDIKKNAVWAVIGSLAVVFLYILLRFRRWQFSLGAVAAVFHDVLIVLGVFSATSALMPFSMEIDQAFIAAILTVIGYSLNDTVVVFDRIREIIAERGWRAGENTNLALNSTLSRTLNTSLTTLVVLLSIFIFGGETLRGFMFAMIVGVIVGTYSSLFIATPIMFDSLSKKLSAGKK
ncbi:protein translocase subunit SecDF [Robiginitalea sp. SC105]|uniref:protein translocase subunit SecDF n=1 Tax=Robiginitalea sp. SC105 TaxID=2762332 RepID=UPI00163AC7B1|nr:protein translocase subunit SecDF [Robiginitalea sp. SC105]MBC2839756.1 protein translocase subunit SecDF [Robiginitalea sp. SC105]